MLIDRTHRTWFIATGTILAIATGLYVNYAVHAPNGPEGGSIVGLLFGIVGSALMVFAALLWVRKKLPLWRIGSAQTWLRAHIWLGSLSVPIILFHAGFRWGGGLEQALWLVLALIVGSGVFGLALQQVLPRDIRLRVPRETFYDQIPHVCDLLGLEADVAVAKLCGPLQASPPAAATLEHLERLGVAGRALKDKLRVVYVEAALDDLPKKESGEEQNREKDVVPVVAAAPPSAPEATPKPAAQESTGESAPKAGPSTADKLAALRAAKKKPAGEKPTAADKPSATTNVVTAAPPQSAKDKIEAIRAAKTAAGGGTTSPPVAPVAVIEKHEAKPQGAALSTADKLAAIRALKKSAAPVAAAAVEVAVVKEPVIPADTPATTVAKKPISTADKLAAIRAAKGAAKPEATAPPAPATPLPPAEAIPAVATPAKSLSAAEKLAAIRAGKPKVASAPADSLPAAAVAQKIAPPKPTVAKAVAKATKPDDRWRRACPQFAKFYLHDVRSFLQARWDRRHTLASEATAVQVFAAFSATLPEELKETAVLLAQLCSERRELATQARLHRWLHGWELVHVPLTMALLVLGAIHAVISLYY